MSFTVDITVPPSLNNAYANNKHGRFLKSSVRQWKADTAWSIKSLVPSSDAVKGPFDVLLELPAAMRGDVDNRLKVCIDAIVQSGRVPDDCKARETTARRSDDVPKGRARITVTPALAYALAGGEAA